MRPLGPRCPRSLCTARTDSFLRGIEWFLIEPPDITPLAMAAPPPSATNRASIAMIVLGLFQVFNTVPPQIGPGRSPTWIAQNFQDLFCRRIGSPIPFL
jgi:hypothetical protein